MRIALGCDHGGLNLKAEIANYLKSQNIEFKDFGTYSEESCDYADIALPVAEAVVAKEYDFGILICGTGIGIGIAANKVPGIRAALCSDTFSAHATREHNDANILTLGERVLRIEVKAINAYSKKENSSEMFEIIEEKTVLN